MERLPANPLYNRKPPTTARNKGRFDLNALPINRAPPVTDASRCNAAELNNLSLLVCISSAFLESIKILYHLRPAGAVVIFPQTTQEWLKPSATLKMCRI